MMDLAAPRMDKNMESEGLVPPLGPDWLLNACINTQLIPHYGCKMGSGSSSLGGKAHTLEALGMAVLVSTSVSICHSMLV